MKVGIVGEIHPSGYEIFDKNNKLRGKFYFDLYARQNKRGGAWMDECIQRRKKLSGSIQLSLIHISEPTRPY